MSNHALIIILLQKATTTPRTSEAFRTSMILAPRSPSIHTTPPEVPRTSMITKASITQNMTPDTYAPTTSKASTTSQGTKNLDHYDIKGTQSNKDKI